MRAGLQHLFLGAGLALGLAAGGCYGDYAGTTTGGGNGTGTGTGAGGGGSTATGTGTGSGGEGGTAAANAPPGGTPTTNYNYDTAPGCSGSMVPAYAGGDGNSAMSPGEACNSCHDSMGGPPTIIGGTVYATAHEASNCTSTSTTGETVVITDAAGHVFKLPVNSVGNFYCTGSRCAGFTPPYNAYVVNSNNVYRAMGAKQTSGDCNSCHTQTGAMGAPGRIIAP